MPTAASATAEPYDRRVRDLAQQTGVSPRSAIRAIDAGKIPAKKFGGVIRLRQSDITAYIERSDRPATAIPEQTPSPAPRRRGRPRVS